MEKIAFINGGTYIYWSSIILALAAFAAILAFAALYLNKSGNLLALVFTIPLCAVGSLYLSRLIHWYCRSDAYESMKAALTDHSWGSYALMGAFIACLAVACLMRVLKISNNLPEMLDCMALGGGVGIAVGRLASLFNASDRGVIVADSLGLPFAYPVTNAVSGAVENRLATFMIQSVLTGAIVLILLLYMFISWTRKNKIKDGDICLLFLLCYGGCQVVLDSTRYDSLFLRSNGFISIVQILGLIAVLVPVVIFSVRMVKTNGLKVSQFFLWVDIVALLGMAAYMEYYVQRHGDKALYTYSIMSACVILTVVLTILIRWFARGNKTVVSAAEEVEE